ncbi:MAG: hypothetical protein CM15mP65_21620 [Crocinitomicaceae bacterium]|nr:MAG: hypothetical protein CM15mP65_21620 [Crocinitomicaceae bacterium]
MRLAINAGSRVFFSRTFKPLFPKRYVSNSKGKPEPSFWGEKKSLFAIGKKQFGLGGYYRLAAIASFKYISDFIDIGVFTI